MKFNDDWSALLTESVQRLDAHGVFYEEPYTSGSNPIKLPPLSVQSFEPSYNEDQFENTALTITGRVSILKLVYDGAYLIRHTSQQQDYTNYARGVYGDYYQCQGGAGSKPGTKKECFSPGATWNDHEQDSHLSQEIRLSTPDEYRLRAIGGFYWEDYKIKEQTNFDYLTDTSNFTPIGPLPVQGVSDPNVRSPSTGFFTDATRGYTQYAIFGSADFDIIPKVLTATFGTRWYDFYDYEKGYVAGSFGCSLTGPYSDYAGPAPCTGGYGNDNNLTAKHLQTRTYGFKSRANLSYKLTPDILFYYTWSQGYRPPGFNRQPPDDRGMLGSNGYASDTLTNNEIGYKASLLDHRLILDGAFYKEDWNNVQESIFAPGVLGNLAFTVNGPNYRVLGTELQATGRPTDDLTLNLNVALNDSKQLNAPGIAGANGGILPGTTTLFAPTGGTLAEAPAFKLSLRARYEMDELPYAPYIQFVLSHTSHERSNVGGTLQSVGNNIQQILLYDVLNRTISAFYQDPITKLDISFGFRWGPWAANFYVDNVTNERGQEFITGTQFVESVVVDRPLTGGAKLSYRF
jgi:outer membrane receptor protein involved in Fe transport